MQSNNGRFTFDGGAATYVGTGVLAFLITVCTLGFGYPFALVLRERWRAKHSYIDGRRLVFTGSAWGLFGNWVKWLLLCMVTLGIYSFWVGPPSLDGSGNTPTSRTCRCRPPALLPDIPTPSAWEDRNRRRRPGIQVAVRPHRRRSGTRRPLRPVRTELFRADVLVARRRVRPYRIAPRPNRP